MSLDQITDLYYYKLLSNNASISKKSDENLIVQAYKVRQNIEFYIFCLVIKKTYVLLGVKIMKVRVTCQAEIEHSRIIESSLCVEKSTRNRRRASLVSFLCG